MSGRGRHGVVQVAEARRRSGQPFAFTGAVQVWPVEGADGLGRGVGVDPGSVAAPAVPGRVLPPSFLAFELRDVGPVAVPRDWWSFAATSSWGGFRVE